MVKLKAAIDNTSPDKNPARCREGSLSHDINSHFKRKAAALDDPFLTGPGYGFLDESGLFFDLHMFDPHHRQENHPAERIIGAGAAG